METRPEFAHRIPTVAAGLCVLAGLMPFAVSLLLHQAHLAPKQLLLVGGAALFALMFAASSHELPVTPLWWPVAALSAACALNAWQAPRIDTAASLVAALVLFGVAAWAFAEPASRERLAEVVTVTAGLQSAYVLCQALWTDPLLPAGVLEGKWRSFGTFGNPNWAGEYLAMAVLITLGRLWTAWSWLRMAALALIAAGLAATFARGAWLACVAAIVALAFAGRAPLSRNLRIAIAAAVVAAIAVIAILSLRPDMFGYLVNSASLRGRLWLWYVTLHLIVAHPLGVGLGSFEPRFAEMQAHCFQTAFGRQFLASASFPPQAHNDFLQIGAEAGVLALAAAAVLAVMILRRGRALASDRTALGFWASVVATLCNALYAFPFFLPGSLALCAIFLGAAEAGIVQRRAIAVSRTVRLAGFAAALAVAVPAWLWCWRHAASEFELRQANRAIERRAWDEAAVALRNALRYDANRLDTHYLQGHLALINEDFTAASAALERAERLGYRSDILTERSAALWRSGRGEEALVELEKLLWLQPGAEGVRRRIIRMRALLRNTGGTP